MRTPSFLAPRAALSACAASLALAAAGALPARAGAPFSEYSCQELWLERNGIYANNGYCFETKRAIKVFGPGCHPPYGHLSGSERRAVAEIQRWERRKGCSD